MNEKAQELLSLTFIQLLNLNFLQLFRGSHDIN